MPILLTTKADIRCVHGGKVVIKPGSPAVSSQGGTVLCEGDLLGAPIAGCPVAPSTNTKPCTTVVSTLPGSTAPKVNIQGRPPYAAALQGMTDGLPPGTLQIVMTGQDAVAPIGSIATIP